MAFLTALYTVAEYIFPFICVLTVVVFVHEMGHFIVGRLCGIKVDAFSLGFGPELFAYTDKSGVRWRLAALPLGGYVKFHGDANAASASAAAEVASRTDVDYAVTFAAQPVWKRAATVAAGPVANFILAILIYACVFYAYGRTVLTPRIDGVTTGGPADSAGFKKGDLILSIDGMPIDSFNELQRVISISANTPLTFVVQRGTQDVTLRATPAPREFVSNLGNATIGYMGLEAGRLKEDWRVDTYGPVDSLRLGVNESWFVVKQTASYLGGVVIGRESPKQLTGPAGLAQVSGVVAKEGFYALLNLIAIVSLSVGLLNLVPIPMLDGGHLLYYAVEAMRGGRALPEKAQEFGFKIGLAFVVGLMAVATFNDVMRLGPQVYKWMISS